MLYAVITQSFAKHLRYNGKRKQPGPCSDEMWRLVRDTNSDKDKYVSAMGGGNADLRAQHQDPTQSGACPLGMSYYRQNL